MKGKHKWHVVVLFRVGQVLAAALAGFGGAEIGHLAGVCVVGVRLELPPAGTASDPVP